MGITGLLPALKSVTHQVHITKYTGKTVGIDAAGWLYRGAYSCAMDVVLRTKNADGYLNYCLEQIKLLQEHDVTPIFVFDGAHLPAKAELNAVWKTKAMRQLDNGDESGSYAAFSKAVSVSNDMVMRFIAVLRRMDIAFIVAPYEADAQLAYMSRHKIIDVVVSEDSDCVPYGCKTMLFKWTSDGWASELKRRSLGANEELSFVGWTEEMFIQLCVLCGCDYCPSVPGVGIVTAYRLVETHKSPIQVVRALQEQKKSALPTNYAGRFYAAIITFRHHLVFDPRDNRMKMLNPLTLSNELLPHVDKELHFLGNIELRDDVVALIARGEVHPVTLESYDWKDVTDALRDEQQQQQQQQQQPQQQHACLAPQPSARSMTSTESSAAERLERMSRRESDEQSNRSTILSQLDACEPDTLDSERRASTATSAISNNELLRSRRALRSVDERADHEQPKAASSSWSHLDSVLGASVHILNFRSPKVSDNFRPLVSLPSRATALAAATGGGGNGTSARAMQAFAHQAVRQSVKRIANPVKRRRAESGSGFDGEVLCRIDASRLPAAASGGCAMGDESEAESESEAAPPPAPLLKRPRPFATTTEADSGAVDGASERSWTAHSSYSRATLAEEKWDRILGADLDARSSNSSSPGPSATPLSDDASHATSQAL